MALSLSCRQQRLSEWLGEAGREDVGGGGGVLTGATWFHRAQAGGYLFLCEAKK